MAEATQSSTEQRSSDDRSSGERSSSEATRASETAHDQSREGHGGKHTHHGRTPAAWAGSITALVGFLIGGFAVVAENWTVFWIAVGICVLAIILTVVMQKMGYGAD